MTELSTDARERIAERRSELAELADSDLPAARHAQALLDALEGN